MFKLNTVRSNRQEDEFPFNLVQRHRTSASPHYCVGFNLITTVFLSFVSISSQEYVLKVKFKSLEVGLKVVFKGNTRSDVKFSSHSKQDNGRV